MAYSLSHRCSNRCQLVLLAWLCGFAASVVGLPLLAEEGLQPAPHLEAVEPFAPSEAFAPSKQLPAENWSPDPNWQAAESLGLPAADPCDFQYFLGGLGRAYYLNDQRFEFTGQEATFGVEGVAAGGMRHQPNDWQCELFGELFLNQPFDRNILVDSPMRRSFASNFDVEPFQISQLNISGRRNDFYVAAGRFVSPFGRFYYPIYQNNFGDSPFIRDEAILYRETGAMVQWDPGWLVMTAALTNGGPERDTNSSKALIARIGIDTGDFACGASVKEQDGIGSEGQKNYKSHYGLDAMVRRGNWTLSGEVIYDQYGIRRPGFQQDDIFWGRSIYYRDLNNGFHNPITGVGYYVNLGYSGERWDFMFNYGDFFPEQLGVPLHDTPNHRGLLKGSYHVSPHWEVYSTMLVENTVPFGFGNKFRHGSIMSIGTQISF